MVRAISLWNEPTDAFVVLWQLELYSRMLIKRGQIWHDITYITAVTEAEYKSKFEPTKYIPYLALRGKLWDVFCED